MDEAEFEQRTREAHALIGIRDSADWVIVSGLIRRKQEQTMKGFFTNRTMTEPEMQYSRGYGAGLEYLLDMVENGERKYAELVAKRKQAEEAKQSA